MTASPATPAKSIATANDTLQAVDQWLVAVSRPASWEAERYRNLRRTVERTCGSDRRHVIGVTSAESGEGKTTTAGNLAAVFAEIPGHKVLLVDADFRCAQLSRALQLDTRRLDLGHAVTDEASRLADVVSPVGGAARPFPFAVIRATPQVDVAHQLVEIPHLAQLMAAARQEYDTVIVDCPPLLWVADCSALSRWIDGFLLVVAAEQTRRERLTEAMRLIEPTKLLGLVLNRDQEPVTKGSRHYYMSYRPMRGVPPGG